MKSEWAVRKGDDPVFFAVQSEERDINERSAELMSLYRTVAEGDPALFQALWLLHGWRLSVVELAPRYAGPARLSCSSPSPSLSWLPASDSNPLVGLGERLDFRPNQSFP